MPQERLRFEYEISPSAERVTAWSGLPLLIEAMAVFGVPESIRQHVKVFRTPRQFDEVNVISSLVLLLAAGGECFDDLRLFKKDTALSSLLGFELPSPETARQFLYEFHQDALVEKAAEEALAAERKSFVPEESAALRALGMVVRDLNWQVQRRWPVAEATVDFDTTFQESHKREAKQGYEGPGYQPMLATWVEQGVVVLDEFRDGNVAPQYEPVGVVKQGFAAIPPDIKKRRMRADSAMYSLPLLRWLCSEGIEFAIGVQMREGIRKVSEAVPEWTHLDTRSDSVLHIAEVDYAPKDWRPDDPKLRYLVIRMTPVQDAFFPEDRSIKYLGVVTNRGLEASELVRWYWGKGGTIEKVHDVLKNELGAGVFPCARFGANAAWLRLCVLTHNLLRVLRSVAPSELKDARPKRLRLHLFAIPALLRTHARQLMARVSELATSVLPTRNALWGLLPPQLT